MRRKSREKQQASLTLDPFVFGNENTNSNGSKKSSSASFLNISQQAALSANNNFNNVESKPATYPKKHAPSSAPKSQPNLSEMAFSFIGESLLPTPLFPGLSAALVQEGQEIMWLEEKATEEDDLGVENTKAQATIDGFEGDNDENAVAVGSTSSLIREKVAMTMQEVSRTNPSFHSNSSRASKKAIVLLPHFQSNTRTLLEANTVQDAAEAMKRARKDLNHALTIDEGATPRLQDTERKAKFALAGFASAVSNPTQLRHHYDSTDTGGSPYSSEDEEEGSDYDDNVGLNEYVDGRYYDNDEDSNINPDDGIEISISDTRFGVKNNVDQNNQQTKKGLPFTYSSIDISRQSEISKLGSRDDIYDSVAPNDNFSISSLNEILDAPTTDNNTNAQIEGAGRGKNHKLLNGNTKQTAVKKTGGLRNLLYSKRKIPKPQHPRQRKSITQNQKQHRQQQKVQQKKKKQEQVQHGQPKPFQQQQQLQQPLQPMKPTQPAVEVKGLDAAGFRDPVSAGVCSSDMEHITIHRRSSADSSKRTPSVEKAPPQFATSNQTTENDVMMADEKDPIEECTLPSVQQSLSRRNRWSLFGLRQAPSSTGVSSPDMKYINVHRSQSSGDEGDGTQRDGQTIGDNESVQKSVIDGSVHTGRSAKSSNTMENSPYLNRWLEYQKSKERENDDDEDSQDDHSEEVSKKAKANDDNKKTSRGRSTQPEPKSSRGRSKSIKRRQKVLEKRARIRSQSRRAKKKKKTVTNTVELNTNKEIKPSVSSSAITKETTPVKEIELPKQTKDPVKESDSPKQANPKIRTGGLFGGWRLKNPLGSAKTTSENNATRLVSQGTTEEDLDKAVRLGSFMAGEANLNSEDVSIIPGSIIDSFQKATLEEAIYAGNLKAMEDNVDAEEAASGTLWQHPTYISMGGYKNQQQQRIQEQYEEPRRRSYTPTNKSPAIPVSSRGARSSHRDSDFEEMSFSYITGRPRRRQEQPQQRPVSTSNRTKTPPSRRSNADHTQYEAEEMSYSYITKQPRNRSRHYISQRMDDYYYDDSRGERHRCQDPDEQLSSTHRRSAGLDQKYQMEP